MFGRKRLLWMKSCKLVTRLSSPIKGSGISSKPLLPSSLLIAEPPCSHLDTTWEDMYTNEPTTGLSPSSDPSLLLGGESCMWGETVDPSDLDQTIWPRAAAVAERLWSPKDAIPADAEDEEMKTVESRLQTFRCLLTRRGIAAAPVRNKLGRNPPVNPGSCYAQRRT